MSEPRIDVFQYLDFRAFLRDYYVAQKQRRGLSFRVFSKRAGLKSPNYLKLVMDGARNLSPEMAAVFANACELDEREAAYFQKLVLFNQARTTEERNECYEALTGFRRYRDAHKLDVAQLEYHSNWYLPAIRELAARADFRDDPKWIARMLTPEISPTEAQRALDRLFELGLLRRAEDGRVEQSAQLVTTGPETKRVYVSAFHRAMMARAAASLDDVPPAERDISSLTLCLSEGSLEMIKQRIQRFRQELLELSALDADPRQVIQIGFQLFPLSKATCEEAV